MSTAEILKSKPSDKDPNTLRRRPPKVVARIFGVGYIWLAQFRRDGWGALQYDDPGKIVSFFPKTFAQIRRLNVPIFMSCSSTTPFGGRARKPSIGATAGRGQAKSIPANTPNEILASASWSRKSPRRYQILRF